MNCMHAFKRIYCFSGEVNKCYYCPQGPMGPPGATGRRGPRGMRGAQGTDGMPVHRSPPGGPGEMGIVGPPGKFSHFAESGLILQMISDSFNSNEHNINMTNFLLYSKTVFTNWGKALLPVSFTHHIKQCSLWAESTVHIISIPVLHLSHWLTHVYARTNVSAQLADERCSNPVINVFS